MGFITREQIRRLKAAGVTSYHHNIETSRRNFPNICTTHTYDMKIETLKMVKEEGLCPCSGGIIGMGETWEDRLDMAISLSEAEADSIPINALMPIKGTPLEDQKPLSEADILRTIAFFRYINPTAEIRLAAGRALLTNDGDLARKLTHPSTGVYKIYQVETNRPVTKDDMRRMLEGIELEDGPIHVDDVQYVNNGEDKRIVGVELHSGRNRIVRRIFESMGYEVHKLDRTVFAGLTKKDLPRGRYRELTPREVAFLKMI